ncbi:putative malate:quinone oxidoreductase [Bienertia sinuspersici]
MGKKKASCEEAARRAWRLLRITFLWARKGHSLKCRLMAELRHMPKHLKGYHKKSKDMIQYGERELSFDETPVLHLRMSRPSSLRFRIPCITPEVTDFDYDFGDDGHDYDDVKYGIYGARKSFLGSNVEDYQDDDDNDVCEEEMVYEDAAIDDKADEFIAKFYEQMKLQRQISYQQRHNVIQAV